MVETRAMTKVYDAADASSPTTETLLMLIEWVPKPEAIAKLQERFPNLRIIDYRTTNYLGDSSYDIDAELLKEVTVLMTYKHWPKVELLPKLKIVQLLSAGCNHVMDGDIWKTRPDVKFCTANGVHPPQIAEWVFATYLSHQHHIPKYTDAMRSNTWLQSDTDEDTEDSVHQRIGILGYGCIGRQCARIASVLGMEVYAYTLRPRSTPESRHEDSYIAAPGMGDPDGVLPKEWYSGSTQEDVNRFLDVGLDLLVIAMPLTDLTRNMIAKPQFEIMSKRKTYISNIGRGPIVNTNELIEALEKGQVRGAALDVTDPEPLPKESKLWEWHNRGVVVTPHISGNSMQYNERCIGILEMNLERLGNGGDLINEVDREAGY